ncbi:hypothetical protein HELRODRAFT_160127 [Helobdella robusta]|uniref:RING-type domain-containing protein n=1 Tax=Helobdella robusta TaxID=6412 RepID=T1EPU4_HELRO|nr:hypothetical protein HELRODRAFT_160127 [Helobdella robusta]ESO06015.1 hypothetical protein HELRODRAFT_160127 [Helobdella robusta]
MYDCTLTSEEQSNFVWQASEDRAPKQDGEMSLIKGDLISDVKLLNDQWGIGRNYRGFVGMFPLRFVVPVDDCSSNPQFLRLPVNSLLDEIGQMSHNDINKFTLSSKSNTSNSLKMTGNVEMADQLESNIENQFVKYSKSQNNIDNENCNQTEDLHKNVPQNQIKGTSNFFSKPKMLVKPRPGNANKITSKNGSSSSLQHSQNSNKDIIKTNATFPAKSCLTMGLIWKPMSSLNQNSHQTKPSPNSSYNCYCKKSTDPNYFNRHSTVSSHHHMSNLELYENVHLQNVNDQIRNSMYSRVNKKPLIKPRSMQTLSNNASFTADSVYSEPNSNKALFTNSLMKQNVTRIPSRTGQKISFLRVAGCAMTSLLIAVFVALMMYFLLSYELLCVFITFCVLSTISFTILLISRLLRCLLAILLPSLATLKGNIFLICIVWVLVIVEPIIHIENNMKATIDSMSCLMEMSYNQTNTILKPYDALINQINKTVIYMEVSAQNVINSLMPLEKNLNKIESEVNYGRISLLGTKKTCLEQMNTAYKICEDSLSQAYKQCQSVLEQIGIVYQQARAALDSLDPYKWGQTHAKYKRDAYGRSNSISSRDNQLICKHLNEPQICKNQVDPEDVCHPTLWVGNAIQEAVNETLSALKQLTNSLQFHVTDAPYVEARSKTIEKSNNFNRKIMDAYKVYLGYFQLALFFIAKICPFSILIVFSAAYNYIKLYVTDDKHDNCYLDKSFDRIDHMISSLTNRPLLTPFSDHEKIYVSNELQYEKSRKGHSQLCIFFLNLLFVGTIYYLCYRHIYALQLISDHQIKQLDGLDSIEMVVVGEGLFVELINVFLKSLHPSKIWNNLTNTDHCVKKLEKISFVILAVIVAVNLLLFLLIVFKRSFRKWRHKIVSYFYKERHQSRLIWLHDQMSFRRSLYPEIIYESVRSKYRKIIMRVKISNFHSCLAKIKSTCKSRRCLVCDSKETNLSYSCTIEICAGVYCASCFRDMRETCPLCRFETIR